MATIRDSTQNTTASGNSVTVTTPTGAQAGDYLLAFVQTDLTGVALVDDSGDFGAALHQDDSWGASGAVFGMLLAGAPDASYTFSFTGTANPMLAALVAVAPGAGEVFDSVVSSEIVDATGSNASITSAAVVVPATPNVLVLGFGNDANRTVATPPADMTLAEFVDDANSDMAVYTQIDVTPGSTQKSITWSSAEQMSAFAVALGFVLEGPTITDQPDAATAVINGPNATTAVFTTAATSSGGSLVSDYEIESAVASGTYANVADGSGLAFTNPGFSGGTATLTVTATTTAKSGCRIRNNVGDDNGTTTSNAVALTVLEGVVQSAASSVTDGSGVPTAVTWTTDDSRAGTQRTRVTWTADGVVLGTTTFRGNTP